MQVVSATILSEGQKLEATYELLSIDITLEVNRIPYAQLVLVDGNPADQEFELSDTEFFEPGKMIDIQLGFETRRTQTTSVFKGKVLRHTIEAAAEGSTLTVEIKDETFRLTAGRKSAVYAEKSDDQIIKKILQDASVKAGAIPPTQPVHAEMVRYYCTDWDFILSRAEVNNLLVKTAGGEVSLKKIETAGSPKLTITYGVDEVYSFEMEADASHQFASIESIAWDIKEQKLTKKSKAAELALAQGNLDGKKIASTLGTSEDLLNSTVNLPPPELQAWADSRLARSRMSLLRGVIAIAGNAQVELLDVIRIEKLGKRFNGNTLVTGIRHQVNADGWITHLQFGLPAAPFSRQEDIIDTPAAGLLPGVQGLQIGLIDEFAEDPDKQFRLKVLLPSIDPAAGSVWARLVAPDAGKERGYFFRPEKGDEVVVGFFNEDPRQAVVLGSLYSAKNAPPQGMEQLDANNYFKGIVSREGIKLLVNDQDKTLTLLTSDQQQVVLDEKNKTILVKDVNNNKITLSDQGIQIEANGDLKLKGNNISLDASANVTIKGAQVDVK